MSVKRYEWVACDEHSCHCDVVESVEGDMVGYEDYAALEARCAALAAELQSVKAMNDCLSEELRGYESDGAFEGPKMHLLWWQCETPNLDAFLAEVRASGIDQWIASRDGRWHGTTAEAERFAAQLRKGVQS
ncbi:TPA: hypothetical protein QIS54_002464 [Enterobacter kobei]|nr:hypothetical protein [Enterobacter kobei]